MWCAKLHLKELHNILEHMLTADSPLLSAQLCNIFLHKLGASVPACVKLRHICCSDALVYVCFCDVTELQRLHDKQIEDMSVAHRGEMEELKTQHNEELKQLLVSRISDVHVHTLPHVTPSILLHCMYVHVYGQA